MKTELKKVIAIKLLDWSISIMPECKLKTELVKVVLENIIKGI